MLQGTENPFSCAKEFVRDHIAIRLRSLHHRPRRLRAPTRGKRTREQPRATRHPPAPTRGSYLRGSRLRGAVDRLGHARARRAADDADRPAWTDASSSAPHHHPEPLPGHHRGDAGAGHLCRRHRAVAAIHPAGAGLPPGAVHHLDRDQEPGDAHRRQARHQLRWQLSGNHPLDRQPGLLAQRRLDLCLRPHRHRVAGAPQLRGGLQGPRDLLVRLSGQRPGAQSAQRRGGHQRSADQRDADGRGPEDLPLRQRRESG